MQIYIHILTPVIAALLMNGLIFSQGLKINKNQNPNPYIPPGIFVGLIWLILFALLGYVHYCLYSGNRNRFTAASIIIILFILYSLAYPIITAFSSNPNTFSLLNQGALLFAAITTAAVYQEDASLLPYMIPLLAWTTYVNLVTMLQD